MILFHPNETERIFTEFRRFIQRLNNMILNPKIPLSATYHLCPDPLPFQERLNGEYKPIQEGEIWGKTWESAWFHVTGSVPKEWKGKTVVADLDFNGEGLVFRDDGFIIQGITNGSIFDANHARSIIEITPKAKGNEKISLWVETTCNGLFGVHLQPDPERNDPERHGKYEGRVNRLQLGVLNRDILALKYDLSTLFSLLKGLPKNSTRFAKIMRSFSQAITVFAENPANALAAREVLQEVLNKPAVPSALDIYAVGHAHIDTGWLWPVRETIRKTARTFSSQLDLIERYPNYIFGASQPQLYAFVKQHYPELYQRVKKAIQKGRWECQGGMWVEADCNIISGESMVRQLLHGKQFFMDEFGVDVRNLWIPDVFGYSGSMPQIMKKAGIDFFVTQKISWNQYNNFPYTTFRWQGVDGTEVITHFPPENTYNSCLYPESLIRAEENFREKDYLPGFLVLFGIGDGGGGPTEEFIEYGLRQKNLEGVSRLQFSQAQKFLDLLTKYKDELPVWQGELYLEIHRGTLTTQSRVKRGNRLLENKLRKTEYFLSLFNLDNYPQEKLDHIWKLLLINQFHDILPGSSIHKVYEQTEQEHQECLANCDQLIEEAAQKYLHRDENYLTLINVLSCSYNRPITLPEGWESVKVVGENRPLLQQKNGEGKVEILVEIPPHSSLVLQKTKEKVSVTQKQNVLKNQPIILANDLIEYRFNCNGQLISAYDRILQWEWIDQQQLPGNLLTLYADFPTNWDAWDIDVDYEERVITHISADSILSVESGPVASHIIFHYRFGESEITQKVTLPHNSRRLEFYNWVHWQERHRMLRVSFPVTVWNNVANFDIQYAYIGRPTHRNTSWDRARFEVAAHKYADVSDNSRGIAILNDCKYGHKIHGGRLDLNLLRSPTHPDPDADVGMHEFTYAIYPHEGTLAHSDTIEESMRLNVSPILLVGYNGENLRLPFTIQSDWVSLEVVKKAEKSNDLILRFVETRGAHGKLVLTFSSDQWIIEETNLMEWERIPFPPPQNNALVLEFKPFEIRTFRLRRKC